MVSTGATITSSSSKQSELRRLMKLQKERKQQPPVVSSTTTLPPPKSILKQPKQKPRIISALVDYGSDSSEEGLSSLDQPLAAATRNKRIIHSDLPQSLSLPSQEQQQQQLPTQPVFNADMAAKIQQQEEVQNDAWKEFETTVLRASNANDALVVGTKEKSIPTYSTELSDSEEPDSVIEHELEQAKYEAKMYKLRQLKQRTQTRNTTNDEITHNKTSAKSQKRSSPALELLQKRRFKQQRLAASIDDDE